MRIWWKLFTLSKAHFPQRIWKPKTSRWHLEQDGIRRCLASRICTASTFMLLPFKLVSVQAVGGVYHTQGDDPAKVGSRENCQIIRGSFNVVSCRSVFGGESARGMREADHRSANPAKKQNIWSWWDFVFSHGQNCLATHGNFHG